MGAGCGFFGEKEGSGFVELEATVQTCFHLGQGGQHR